MIVKICGMREQETLDTAAACGADMAGFIFARSSPRALRPAEAARLDTGVMRRVGVFTTDSQEEILSAAALARLDLIQLHGGQPDALVQTLARTFGAEHLIRVFWPQRYTDRKDLERDLLKAAPDVGYFLLDAGRGGGGHGSALDAAFLAGLESPRPWLLAGGLNCANVTESVARCRPDGVDFNSGLEDAPGRKNPALIRAALSALEKLGTDNPLPRIPRAI